MGCNYNYRTGRDNVNNTLNGKDIGKELSVSAIFIKIDLSDEVNSLENEIKITKSALGEIIRCVSNNYNDAGIRENEVYAIYQKKKPTDLFEDARKMVSVTNYLNELYFDKLGIENAIDISIGIGYESDYTCKAKRKGTTANANIYVGGSISSTCKIREKALDEDYCIGVSSNAFNYINKNSRCEFEEIEGNYFSCCDKELDDEVLNGIKSRVITILNEEFNPTSSESIEDINSLNECNKIIECNTSTIFIDIVSSTKYIEKVSSNVDVIKVYYSLIAEMLEVLYTYKDQVIDIGIRGDCVYATYLTTKDSMRYEVAKIAAVACTCNKMIRRLLKQNGFELARVGIGTSSGVSYLVKIGSKGSGISDIVYFGDTVKDAKVLGDTSNRNKKVLDNNIDKYIPKRLAPIGMCDEMYERVKYLYSNDFTGFVHAMKYQKLSDGYENYFGYLINEEFNEFIKDEIDNE